MSVVVLALDSADPGIAHRLAAEGRMPHLRDFLASATWATTENPPGFVAGATWPTLTTGSWPDHHGFYWDLQIEPGTYEARRRGPHDIPVPRLWDVLAAAGRRCAVFDVPICAPTERDDVVHLVEYGSHSLFVPLGSAPPTLADEILEEFGPYPVLPKCDDWAARGEQVALAEAIGRAVGVKERIAHAYLDRGPWDLFWYVFSEAHCAGHQLWALHDPSDPAHDPELRARLGDPLLDVYERIDGALGGLLDRIDSSSTVVVLLSHGMGPRDDGDHLLAEILLRLDVADDGPRRLVTLRERAHRRLERRARVARRGRPLVGERRFFKVPTSHLWSGVRVNVRGREPRGRVARGAEYDAVVAQLSDDLLALENPATGGPVVRAVRPVDDIYDGPQRERLPDLFVVWHGGAPIRSARSPKIGTVSGSMHGVRTGDHRGTGVFAVRGPGTVPGRRSEAMAAVDVSPTIAAWLDVTMPEVQGRPVPGLGVSAPT